MPRHSAPPTVSLGVVILAAGASSRMGTPKLLLPWRGTSVIGHLIAQWQKAGAEQIAVVTAAGGEGVHQEMDRLEFPNELRILNPTPETGMFGSIRCAARWAGWKEGLSHWVIVLGDQPHLKLETFLSLVELGSAHPEKVCQLSRQGRPRHPVLLPRSAFQQLGDSRHRDLKEFLKEWSAKIVLQENEDEGLDLDIDRPADYERALRMDEPQSVKSL